MKLKFFQRRLFHKMNLKSINLFQLRKLFFFFFKTDFFIQELKFVFVISFSVPWKKLTTGVIASFRKSVNQLKKRRVEKLVYSWIFIFFFGYVHCWTLSFHVFYSKYLNNSPFSSYNKQTMTVNTKIFYLPFFFIHSSPLHFVVFYFFFGQLTLIIGWTQCKTTFMQYTCLEEQQTSKKHSNVLYNNFDDFNFTP